MRTLLLLTCVVLAVGCGRGAVLEPTTGDTENLVLPSQPALAGRYAFGPMVAKGFAGTPGRLAHLFLADDGTFDMTYGSGCLLQGTLGAWAPGTPALLSPSRANGWTDEDGNELDVAQVRATHVPGTLFTAEGLRLDFTDATGRTFTQFWDRLP